MTIAATRPVVRFSPTVEQRLLDEADTTDGLNGTLRKIVATTSRDYGRAVRGLHAKGQGIIAGRLTIHDGLPLELAQAFFSRPHSYDAILRLSTASGDILEDAVSAPRGAALKILNVPGARLRGSERDTTQDFLFVNGPTFGARTPAAFLNDLNRLAATTDRSQALKKAWSAMMRALEGTIEAFGGHSSRVSSLGGAQQRHPLGETYYSQTAFRYGDHIAKFALVPVSPGMTDVTGDTVHTADRPNALREVVREVMIEQGGVWEFRVQLCTDLKTMPVEDATIEWSEETSPFQTVATFEAEPQFSWMDGASDRLEERLAFSPWHGVTALQPLGAINRARKATYDFSADFRGAFNTCPIHEPSSRADVPSAEWS